MVCRMTRSLVGVSAVVLLLSVVCLLCGCSSGGTAARSSMIGDWDDGGGHGMSATFFSDGTWTANGYNGHGHWRVEADKLYGVPSASDWDGIHYMVWRDENHLDLVDVKFMERSDVSGLSPAETARRFHGKLGIQSWVRICPATRHGNQYY